MGWFLWPVNQHTTASLHAFVASTEAIVAFARHRRWTPALHTPTGAVSCCFSSLKGLQKKGPVRLDVGMALDAFLGLATRLAAVMGRRQTGSACEELHSARVRLRSQLETLTSADAPRPCGAPSHCLVPGKTFEASTSHERLSIYTCLRIYNLQIDTQTI